MAIENHHLAFSENSGLGHYLLSGPRLQAGVTNLLLLWCRKSRFLPFDGRFLLGSATAFEENLPTVNCHDAAGFVLNSILRLATR